MDWTVRCSNPGRYKRFLFSPNVQTNLGVYSKGTEIFFSPGVKLTAYLHLDIFTYLFVVYYWPFLAAEEDKVVAGEKEGTESYRGVSFKPSFFTST
jgi:hypothetical protein